MTPVLPLPPVSPPPLPPGFEESLRGWPDPAAAEALAGVAPGYDTAWWRTALGRGWFPSPDSRSGFGVLVREAERLGAAAMPTPLLNGFVLGGFALLFAGDARAHREHLAPLVSGERRYATGLTGRAGSYAPDGTHLVARPHAEGWVLDGAVCFVPHAADADVLLVLARSGDGHTLFAVDPAAAGVSARLLPTLGRDGQCEITMNAVRLPASAVVGTPGAAWNHVKSAIDRTLIVQCADMVGAADGALRHTVEHVKTRHQWGLPLGVLQSVQHRCADMLTDVTACRDAVYAAAALVEAGEPLGTTASVLKALCAPRCRAVSAAAHQLAGGEGIHADVPLHLWYRRIKAGEPMLGGPRFHRSVLSDALLGPSSTG
ncbi:MAG: acyl-CoA dehydrogenase [Streptomycetaceae bacterium]|jgi:alkylation response protein AidB-like acyl-CoA dehydrogenase|nr:acyl-CoA dehydrogenase [Streptomycetaceae bacterium]NUS59271.1 acyl-CoA dehydrogenase [Streptomycetaceae bacterium]